MISLKIIAIVLIAIGFFFGPEIDNFIADMGLNISIPIWNTDIIPGIWTVGLSLGPSIILMIVGVLILLLT